MKTPSLVLIIFSLLTKTTQTHYSFSFRLQNRPGRTALCRDLMDVVTEITENGEALNDGNNNNDIIPPSSINDNKDYKEIQGFDVMPEQDDLGEDVTAHVSVDNEGKQGVPTSSSSSKKNDSSNNYNSNGNNNKNNSSSSSSSHGTYRYVNIPSGSNPSTMPSPSPSSPSSSSSAFPSRSIRTSVIIVTDSIPADGEVITGKLNDLYLSVTSL